MTPAQAKSLLAVAIADVTGLTAALAAKGLETEEDAGFQCGGPGGLSYKFMRCKGDGGDINHYTIRQLTLNFFYTTFTKTLLFARGMVFRVFF